MSAIAEIAATSHRARDQLFEQTPKRPPSEVDIDRALSDAELLIRHAAELGLELGPELIAQIQAARDVRQQGQWTPEVAKSFWPAYSALCTAVKPVTAESLKACIGGALTKTLTSYRRATIWLTTIILPLSVILFVNTSITNEIGDRIKENDALALTLRDRLNALQASSAPSSANAPTPVGVSQLSLERDAVTTLQQFATANRMLYARTNLLNGFILHTERDPFHDLSPQKKHDALELPIPLDSESIPKAGFTQIGTYQEVRAYAKGLQQSNLVVFGALTVYVLPILYALLGACAYALRSLSQQVTDRTYVPSHAAFARIIIALIAGLVVGLFNNFTQGVSLSPLAIAFLVGYAVEIFFSFLDAFLDTLKKVRS